MPKPSLAASVVVALLALASTACAVGERPTLTGVSAVAPTTTPTTTPATTTTFQATAADALLPFPEGAGGEPTEQAVDVAWVATAAVPELSVYGSPTGAEVQHVMANPTSIGGPLVFLVEETLDDWHRVLLPIRPNGSTGWVRDADVTLNWHQYRLEVHLEDFRLSVFHEGDRVFETIVGVARDNAPTPGGRYYITELLQPPDPSSVYGTFAYGLSGFSEVFESFNGGAGQLGIHGTNDPSSIGTKASSGCVRLANDDIEALAAFLPLGTPVEVFT